MVDTLSFFEYISGVDLVCILPDKKSKEHADVRGCDGVRFYGVDEAADVETADSCFAIVPDNNLNSLSVSAMLCVELSEKGADVIVYRADDKPGNWKLSESGAGELNQIFDAGEYYSAGTMSLFLRVLALKKMWEEIDAWLMFEIILSAAVVSQGTVSAPSIAYALLNSIDCSCYGFRVSGERLFFHARNEGIARFMSGLGLASEYVQTLGQSQYLRKRSITFKLGGKARKCMEFDFAKMKGDGLVIDKRAQ